MKTVYINRYAFGVVALVFDDADFNTLRFARNYSFERAIENATDLCYSIAKTVSGVEVGVSDGEKKTFANHALAFGFIDLDLDRRVRSVASDSLLSVHASSAVLDGEAILFPGLSGCGKTTLGIEVARLSGETLGDEYAFVDPLTGTVRFEPYPLQVKHPDAPGLPVSFPSGTASWACCYTDLGIERVVGLCKLGAIVLPHRQSGLADVSMDRVSAAELHKRLMPSVLGGTDRRTTYRVLTRMLSEFGIGVFELCYGDATDAARYLLGAWTSGLVCARSENKEGSW